MLPRTDEIYRHVKASDSLFDPKHMQVYKSRVKGIQKDFNSVSGGPPKNWMKDAMLPEYEEDPTRYTKNAFSKERIREYESPRKVKDYKGNIVMAGVDYRNTSLHYNRGVSLEA